MMSSNRVLEILQLLSFKKNKKYTAAQNIKQSLLWTKIARTIESQKTNKLNSKFNHNVISN